VREYLAQALRERQLAAWREGHRRLYEYLKASVPHHPDGLAGLQPHPASLTSDHTHVAYAEFTFQKLETDLHLLIEEADLYSVVAPVQIGSTLADILRQNIPLALAINTEKARSELLIAPVLVELRKMLAHRVSLFSGHQGARAFCR
jgi:hypothetical protein